ncbi:MAG: hypothetical protein K2L56_03615 [Prevotella sp.]|nr:hypothetical protein [Prevotella sp.]
MKSEEFAAAVPKLLYNDASWERRQQILHSSLFILHLIMIIFAAENIQMVWNED